LTGLSSPLHAPIRGKCVPTWHSHVPYKDSAQYQGHQLPRIQLLNFPFDGTIREIVLPYKQPAEKWTGKEGQSTLLAHITVMPHRRNTVFLFQCLPCDYQQGLIVP